MAKLKYDEDFPKRAEDFARQGLRDEDIAKKLGISKQTFYDYQKMYPDFLDAIKKGKAPIDFEVENALLKRARGFEYEEVQIEYKPGEGEKLIPVHIKKTKKIVIPDTTACIFHLKNRRPGRWRDRHDFAIDGNVLLKVITAVPRSTDKKPPKKPSSKKSPQGKKDTRVKKKEKSEEEDRGSKSYVQMQEGLRGANKVGTDFEPKKKQHGKNKRE